MGKRIRRLGLFVACATGAVAVQAIPLAMQLYHVNQLQAAAQNKPLELTAANAFVAGAVGAITNDVTYLGPLVAGKAVFDHFDKHNHH